MNTFVLRILRRLFPQAAKTLKILEWLLAESGYYQKIGAWLAAENEWYFKLAAAAWGELPAALKIILLDQAEHSLPKSPIRRVHSAKK